MKTLHKPIFNQLYVKGVIMQLVGWIQRKISAYKIFYMLSKKKLLIYEEEIIGYINKK